MKQKFNLAKKISISIMLGFVSLLIIGFFNAQICVSYKFESVKYTINLVETAFDQFKFRHGINPPYDNWQNELLGNSKAKINTLKICYAPSIKDSWGNELRVIIPGKHNNNGVDVYSVGADGISKTNGNDPDDLNTWSPSHNGGYYRSEIAREGVYSILLQWLLCSLVAFVLIHYGFNSKMDNICEKTDRGYLVFSKTASVWTRENHKKILSTLLVIVGFILVFILTAAQDFPAFTFDTGSELPAFLVTFIYSTAVFILKFRINASRYTALTLAIFSLVMFAVRFAHYTMR